jgi:hypothetical protein
MALSGKKTDNGRLYFGDKTADFLKKKSRQAVETYHNAPILFFAIDWTKSKRNFYGEMTVKKFVNPKGVPVKGIYKFTQSEPQIQNGIPNKTLKLVVSIYVDQLEELGIDPQQGDYFAMGKRYYQIYDRSIADVGPGSLMMNRGNVRRDYYCNEADDETIQKNPFGDNLGQEVQINPETDLI